MARYERRSLGQPRTNAAASAGPDAVPALVSTSVPNNTDSSMAAAYVAGGPRVGSVAVLPPPSLTFIWGTFFDATRSMMDRQLRN